VLRAHVSPLALTPDGWVVRCDVMLCKGKEIRTDVGQWVSQRGKVNSKRRRRMTFPWCRHQTCDSLTELTSQPFYHLQSAWNRGNYWGAGRLRNRGSSPDKNKNFISCPQPPDWLWVLPSLLSNLYPGRGAFAFAVNRQGRETGRQSLSGARD
jgi:hypothetical protein